MSNFLIRGVVRSADEARLLKMAEETGKRDGLFLQLPHGLVAPGVETAVACREDGSIVCGVTGAMGIVLDPLIKDPNAKPLELLQALIQTSRAMEMLGTTLGAVDAYTIIPDTMPEYQRIVERCGFKRVGGEAVKFSIFTRDLSAQGAEPLQGHWEWVDDPPAVQETAGQGV